MGSFIAARGFSLSSSGVRAPGHVGSVVWGTWALVEARELNLACGLSYPVACGTLVP